MELIIYDSSFKILGSVEDIIDASTARRFFEKDVFTVTVPVSEQNLLLLSVGNYVYFIDDDFFGTITSRVLTLDEYWQETLMISGAGADGIFENRIIWGRINETSITYESLMRRIISECLTSPTDGNRDCHGWALGPAVGYTETTAYEKSFGNAMECLEALSSESGIGFIPAFNKEARTVTISLKKGVNRRADQSENRRAVFSRSLYNIRSQKYTSSVESMANCALIGGEGEDDARVLVSVVDSGVTGWGRKEIFVDARDLQKGSLSDSDYSNQLTQRGREKLAEKTATDSMEGTYQLTDNMPDFVALGDIVTVYDDTWGLEMHTQLTEIVKSYRSGAANETKLSFGSAAPSMIKKLKRM